MSGVTPRGPLRGNMKAQTCLFAVRNVLRSPLPSNAPRRGLSRNSSGKRVSQVFAGLTTLAMALLIPPAIQTNLLADQAPVQGSSQNTQVPALVPGPALAECSGHCADPTPQAARLWPAAERPVGTAASRYSATRQFQAGEPQAAPRARHSSKGTIRSGAGLLPVCRPAASSRPSPAICNSNNHMPLSLAANNPCTGAAQLRAASAAATERSACVSCAQLRSAQLSAAATLRPTALRWRRRPRARPGLSAAPV